MITPNSLQVKNYFGNARLIKSLSSHTNFEITDTSRIYLSLGCYWYRNDDETSELIWDDHMGYAKILENK